MENNTIYNIKKNINKIRFLLLLTLPLSPCIVSCVHNNNTMDDWTEVTRRADVEMESHRNRYNGADPNIYIVVPVHRF